MLSPVISDSVTPQCIWFGDSGWGLLSQFPPFCYFPIFFSALPNPTLAIEYHVYIWQVSPQLSCVDTCQIWMWFEESNMYFCQVENFAYGEINKQSFSNPHPWTIWTKWTHIEVPSYQYRKSHCGDKTAVRSSYLHNGISCSSKVTRIHLYIESAHWSHIFKTLWVPNQELLLKTCLKIWTHLSLTQSGLVMPYGDIKLGHQWLR